MMYKIETLIKKIFLLARLEIHWCANAQGMIIHDPVEFNSLKQMNAFYSNKKHVKRHLAPSRIVFYHNVIKLAHNRISTFNQKSTADIGCGPGHLLKILSEEYHVANTSGFEYSDAALKIAETTCPNTSFFKFDVYEGSSQKFDVLFCTEVLEHLLFPRNALKNIIEMLTDNGTLIITVPNGRTDTFMGHINFWSPESWKIFIEENCGALVRDVSLIEDGTINYAIISIGE